MLKAIAQFKSIVNDRESTWNIDNDCPIEIAKEILFQFQKMLGHIEDNVKAQQESKKVEEDAKRASEEPKVEQIG
jgi:hypothetical protein